MHYYLRYIYLLAERFWISWTAQYPDSQMHGIDAAAFVQVQFPALPQLGHRPLLPPEYIVTAIGKDQHDNQGYRYQ